MVFKRFRIVLLGRVLLLCGFIFLFFYLILQTRYYAATSIVILVIIYQISTLIHYVEKTNRDLTRFLDAIKYSDFSQTFVPGGLGSSFTELKDSFNEVIRRFQKARAEKEEHYRYLQTIVQHIGIGLLSFDGSGAVSLINSAAKRLLSVPYLKNIRALAKQYPGLVETLVELKAGQKALIKIENRGNVQQLMVYATEFRMQNRRFTLVSLQNIGAELEEKEMEAWQKLIRVLTHEIMNSITPISSLAATAGDLLADAVQENSIPKAAAGDITNALDTIQNRSRGLMMFVDAYRNLTRIPRPNFQIFPVSDLFERCRTLFRAQEVEKKIHLRLSIQPGSLELTADPELVEQILINLLLNAVHAVESADFPRIDLRSFMDEGGHVVVEVGDNGIGISREVQEKIFIPFFTTKKGGSGIGLSLARQIMRMHRGNITVQSEPGRGTVFALRF